MPDRMSPLELAAKLESEIHYTRLVASYIRDLIDLAKLLHENCAESLDPESPLAERIRELKQRLGWG
jgi:hypothetical protein